MNLIKKMSITALAAFAMAQPCLGSQNGINGVTIGDITKLLNTVTNVSNPQIADLITESANMRNFCSQLPKISKKTFKIINSQSKPIFKQYNRALKDTKDVANLLKSTMETWKTCMSPDIEKLYQTSLKIYETTEKAEKVTKDLVSQVTVLRDDTLEKIESLADEKLKDIKNTASTGIKTRLDLIDVLYASLIVIAVVWAGPKALDKIFGTNEKKDIEV